MPAVAVFLPWMQLSAEILFMGYHKPVNLIHHPASRMGSKVETTLDKPNSTDQDPIRRFAAEGFRQAWRA
jgi:hypothetical protein